MSTPNGKKISRRDLIKAASLTAGAVALAACVAPATAPSGGNQPSKEQPTAAAVAPSKQYTILHWAQTAEPTDPNAQLAAGQARHQSYQIIADEYMKMKPNVTIDWYRFPAGAQFYEWLAARMTAQDSPDIYWANTEDIWPHISQ